jgi:hypothetical protein
VACAAGHRNGFGMRRLHGAHEELFHQPLWSH